MPYAPYIVVSKSPERRTARAICCRLVWHVPGALASADCLVGGGADFPAVVRACARLIVRLRLRVNRHVHDGNVNQAGGDLERYDLC